MPARYHGKLVTRRTGKIAREQVASADILELAVRSNSGERLSLALSGNPPYQQLVVSGVTLKGEKRVLFRGTLTEYLEGEQPLPEALPVAVADWFSEQS